MNERSKALDYVLELVADALSRARPPGIAPSLDSAFQHKRDCQSIADALAAHVPGFDAARFLAKAGWNERDEQVDNHG